MERNENSRGLCLRCLRAPLTCYCASVRRFDPKIEFAILIHQREAQKRIATGRMAFLSLEGSRLLSGYDYSNDDRVNSILRDPSYFPLVLYPGDTSKNLSQISIEERQQLFSLDRKIIIFVIDGTWTTARKTLQRSQNLARLPQICFDVSAPSRYRIRRQPEAYCLSTLEAIYQTIELVGNTRGFDIESRAHDSLLETFDKMIDQQIELAKQPKLSCYWPRRRAPKDAAPSAR